MGNVACTSDATSRRGQARPQRQSLVPDPVGYRVTRWQHDPWARGAFSYLPPGTSSDTRRALAAPIGGRLFFAGEATSTDHAATVHGAYASGVRAADEVISAQGSAARVVVIGAGLAGLAAAGRLDERHGLASVVLEAQQRVGGRIRSDDSLGGPVVELGAMWLRGVDGNPVQELADRFQLPRRAVDQRETVRERGGRTVSSNDEGRLDRSFAAWLGHARQESATLGPAATLADGLARARRNRPASGVERDRLDFALATRVALEHGADAARLSLAHWDDGTPDLGGDVWFPEGLGRLPAILADDVDVRRSHPVDRVEWRATGVTVRSGSAAFDADAVIVTVPLGVLKVGSPSFDPPLPADTVAAIANLGNGSIEKCALHFPHRFWEDVDLIGFVSPRPGHWSQWVNPSRGPSGARGASSGSGGTLVGMNAGSFAASLARRPDREVVTDALASLRIMYG